MKNPWLKASASNRVSLRLKGHLKKKKEKKSWGDIFLLKMLL
jgi:hypothetical protein